MTFPKNPLTQCKDNTLMSIRFVSIGAAGFMASFSSHRQGVWKLAAFALVLFSVMVYGDVRAEIAARSERRRMAS